MGTGDPPGLIPVCAPREALVTLGLSWVCKQGCTDPGCETVCASALCTCQMQGQRVCFHRAKALWKCWHSCRRIKYFLPQQCGKEGSCPALLQAARCVSDPTAERFPSGICSQEMLPWSAGGETVLPHFKEVSGTTQCWPSELESPKIQPLFKGCEAVSQVPLRQRGVLKGLGGKL